MKRRDFIKICGLLGISLSLRADEITSNTKLSGFSGSVLIIGSGAAGMSAGFLLAQKGIDFKILEASDTYGGRMKRTTTFADFPIPLGAEWLHVSKKELANIVNDTSTAIKTRLRGYSGQEMVGYYEDGHLSYSSLSESLGSDFHDKKFINSTWFDFFDEYIIPEIRAKIQLNTQVVSINYHGHQVIVTDSKGSIHKADKVILTVPLKMLQNKTIDFIPEFPPQKIKAIKNAPVWGGLKAFIEFNEKFYPAFLAFPDSETDTGQRVYFDASYAQDTSLNVLGLFAVGKQAKPYQSVSANDQLADILNELDMVFDGKASRSYVKHIVKDWDKEPFIHSAYLADVAPSSIANALSTPIGDRLYFAGDSYTHDDDWGGVHNATQSARHVVKEIFQTQDQYGENRK